MEQESAYLAALGSAVTYQAANGQLAITNGSGQIVLTYAELAATPLQ